MTEGPECQIRSQKANLYYVTINDSASTVETILGSFCVMSVHIRNGSEASESKSFDGWKKKSEKTIHFEGLVPFLLQLLFFEE